MIEAERLLLRKPRLEDAADLAVAYANPEVVRFMGDGSTATPAEVERGIEQWLERWESWGLSLFSLEPNTRSIGVAERIGETYERDVEIDGKPGRLYSVER